MEYETLVSAANSIAHKNGVPLDVGMLWARQNVAEGSIVITGKKKEQELQMTLILNTGVSLISIPSSDNK